MQPNELHRYRIHKGTRVVFARHNQSPVWSLLVLVIIACFFVMADAAPALVLMAVGIFTGGFTQDLRVLAVEQDGFVLIRKASFLGTVVVRIPFECVTKVVQGNEFRSEYLTLVVDDGTRHDISFRTRRRHSEPRFGITVNKTSYPFPTDSRKEFKQSAVALVGYLLEIGLPVTQLPVSRFEKFLREVVWEFLREAFRPKW